MDVFVKSNKSDLGQVAAGIAAEHIRSAIDTRGAANLILATGASQFEMLNALVQAELDWQRVTCFHLDEYIGLPEAHPASFRKFLRERFVDRIDGPKVFHWIDPDERNPQSECDRVGAILREHPIDVACIGIGENGHLAFNDPPADFEATTPYLVVQLDEACRRQQQGEGWFPTLADVPTQAISMSVQQILASSKIVCTVPDKRKAKAVQAAVEGPVTAAVPASILQQHPQTTLLLDTAAASLLVDATSSG